jgi:DNA-binding transcriptional ArsR family regulator
MTQAESYEELYARLFLALPPIVRYQDDKMKIMALLSDGKPRPTSKIAICLNLKTRSVSYHLGRLKASGSVFSTPQLGVFHYQISASQIQ